MLSPRDTWQAICERFDPFSPSEARWRVERDGSPIEEIVGALNRPWEMPHVLLMGATGTGKSTELLRLAEERAAKGDEVVIFLDLDRHFNLTIGDAEALPLIASWEVCYLVGVALLRAAEDRLGYKFPEEQRTQLAEAWKLLAKETGTPLPGPQVDVGALSKSLILLVSAAAAPTAPAATAGLKLLEGAAGAVKWSMGRSKKAITDQDPSAQNLLACVNTMLATFKKWSRSVLFIIDGLDRISDIGRAEKLFVESEMIGRLECPLVICAPFPLRNHMATAVAHRFSEKLILANVSVLRQDDPRRYNANAGTFLWDLYKKRVADLRAEGWIAPADLERLAYYSGGRLRDFVNMIRRLAGDAWTANVQRTTTEMVDKVLKKERLLQEQGLDRGHIDLLETIIRDPQHRLPDDKRVGDLLKYGRLLPYANGSEWFYPHPLLTIRFLSAEPPGSEE